MPTPSRNLTDPTSLASMAQELPVSGHRIVGSMGWRGWAPQALSRTLVLVAARGTTPFVQAQSFVVTRRTWVITYAWYYELKRKRPNKGQLWPRTR